MPRFEAIGVVVGDLARSAAFYRELGLEFPEPLDPEGHGHVEASLPGGLRFMLDTEETVRSFDPEWSPPAGGGHRSAIAFRCDSPAEVDTAYARLLEVGGEPHKEPWDAFWGQRYAEVKDPDGNVVDLFAGLEG
jgi:catechol 2,3-dioxygenase-like lactoylglutathione lyase family enzyme